MKVAKNKPDPMESRAAVARHKVAKPDLVLPDGFEIAQRDAGITLPDGYHTVETWFLKPTTLAACIARHGGEANLVAYVAEQDRWAAFARGAGTLRNPKKFGKANAEGLAAYQASVLTWEPGSNGAESDEAFVKRMVRERKEGKPRSEDDAKRLAGLL